MRIGTADLSEVVWSPCPETTEGLQDPVHSPATQDKSLLPTCELGPHVVSAFREICPPPPPHLIREDEPPLLRLKLSTADLEEVESRRLWVPETPAPARDFARTSRADF